MKRLDLASGAPIPLAKTADSGGGPLGTWGPDGTVLFGSSAGVQRIAASGGPVTQLTKPDAKLSESAHAFPQFLPDGKRFLYLAISTDASVQGVYISSLEEPEKRQLVVRTDAKAVYVSTPGSAKGHLLRIQGNTLLAQTFDPETGQLEGDAVTIAPSIARNPGIQSRVSYWASDAGTIVFFSAAQQGDQRTVTLMNRAGKKLGDVGEPARLGHIALSPDRSRLALRLGLPTDIWVRDLARSLSTRLTFNASAGMPVWSADGKQVAYVSLPGNRTTRVFRKDASGGTQEQLLFEMPGEVRTSQLSPDGKYLLYWTEEGGGDIYAWPLDGTGKGKGLPVLVSPFNEIDARISPDGKWLAYLSNESGTQQVYIRPFLPGTPTQGVRWQVSDEDGFDLAWREDSRELFYENGAGEIISVAVAPEGEGLRIAKPERLFSSGSAGDFLETHSFDAAADGQSFVVLQRPGTSVSDQKRPLTVMMHWQSSLGK